MTLQDLENQEVAEKWFNKGLQIGSGREPNKEDAPYRGAPKEGDPDYTPPPSFPGQDVPKLQLAHNFWDGESLSDKWGAVVMPDGQTWMLPTKEGTLRQATEEESIMLQEDRIHREQFNQNTPHHQEGWDQASIYMGEQFPNKFDQILNPRGDFSRPSVDQLRRGVEEKKRTGAI